MAIGIGIVGAGFMSLTYCLRDPRAGAGRAAWSPSIGGRRAAEFGARFGMAVEPSLDALLARPDVDVVLLGSPTRVHRDQAMAAAAAGKHVFTEKPIAATLPEIDAMIAACRRGRRAPRRQRRDPLAARRPDGQGPRGCRRDRRDPDGPPHLCPRRPAATRRPATGSCRRRPGARSSIRARTATTRSAGSSGPMRRPRSPPTPLTPAPSQSARARWSRSISPNGAMCQIWASYEWPEAARPREMDRDYLFVGSKGMLDVQYRGWLRIHRGFGWETLYVHPPVQQPEPDIDVRVPLRGPVQDFVEAIEAGREPQVNGEEARKGIEMAIAADRSAASGEVVRLPLTG